mgnify:CR=1 FL=1
MRKAKSVRQVKDRRISVRLTSNDIIEILKLSRDKKVSVSELIRQRVLNINPNKFK